MKYILLIIACLLFSFGNAQIDFERGYILTSDNVKKEVFINNHYNVDRNGAIEYRLNQNSDIKKAEVEDILAFGIGDDIKYVSRNVEIEAPGTGNKRVESKKEPILKDKRVFLKVHVEGEASLYEYAPGGQAKYYYKAPGKDKVELLIFRKYSDEANKIRENNEFKKQLFDNLNCSDDTAVELRNTRYNINKLINYFLAYNNCANSSSKRYFEQDSRVEFNFNIKPGLNYSTFQLFYGNPNGSSREFSKVSELGFRPAIEAEVILPFYKNKFAVFMELSHLSFNYEEFRYDQDVKVSFSSLEIPLGLRYYMFLNDNSKLFIDAAFVPIANFNSSISLHTDDYSLSNQAYIQSGIGAKFLDKYSIELRYSWTRDIVTEESLFFSEFSTIGLILGYTLF